MWNTLKLALTGTSATRLRALTLTFETYKMARNEKMAKHFKKMSAIICDLKPAQGFYVQPQRQDKENLDKYGESRKRKKGGKHHKGKRGIKKDTSKLKCYNCKKPGHFAREYMELKKGQTNLYSQIDYFICSHVSVAHSFPNWEKENRRLNGIAWNGDKDNILGSPQELYDGVPVKISKNQHLDDKEYWEGCSTINQGFRYIKKFGMRLDESYGFTGNKKPGKLKDPDNFILFDLTGRHFP
ncbi:hypothetical protein RJ640_002709 [Escallonia rubra]|uniref:CCHC-type domain-containing protein n=1 Tax=Escallonia rubra TaxID=112253 RepID=A0AA88SKV9_9ASTE|nr:hypothetical protein RJ640_002709 [Escallonia rubra]